MKATDFLITGGAGFIGSHLARALLADGARVRVLDNFLTGKRENIEDLESQAGFKLVEGDIRDLSTVQEAMKGIRFVLHQAALPSVPRSVSDPATTTTIGVNGTLNLLVAARDVQCERFVYASSSSVYGNTPTLPKTESMLPGPLSPYAVSKLTGEHLCSTFTHLFHLPTVSLRYFNVFGPRQDPNSQYAAVVPRFTTALLAGEAPVIYGDGEQTRDFTYIENVIQANRLACQAAEPAWGLAVNIACGERISVNELARRIAIACGHPEVKPRHDPARPGDVRHSLADTSRAEDLLKLRPAVDLDEGLGRTVEWYRSA
jgi:nucleoside-diphosphate-sugar epimerase